jgi:hypothetical protein
MRVGNRIIAAAKAHAVEVEAAPIMYVGRALRGTTEQAIGWLISAMVRCCDPLAIALRPRRRREDESCDKVNHRKPADGCSYGARGESLQRGYCSISDENLSKT